MGKGIMSELTDKLKRLAQWTHDHSDGLTSLEVKIKAFKDAYYKATDEQKDKMEEEWSEMNF